MNGLKQLITTEPVMVQGLVQAGIAMLVGFGLGWSADQVALVLAFTATLLAVVARTLVTPTVKAEAAVQDAKDDARAKSIVERAMSPDLTPEEWSSLNELRDERDRLAREAGR